MAGKTEGKLDTLIGKTTRVSGNIITQGSVRVDGRIEGNLETPQTLITGQGSFIKGDVRCRDAILGGRIEGNIYALGMVEMQSGASLLGDITCKGLVIQPKVFFEGHCKMSQEK